MRILFILVFFLKILPAISQNNGDSFDIYIRQFYETCNLHDKGLHFDAFRFGIYAYYNLSGRNLLNNKDIIVIIDYSQSSCKERLYIINIRQKKLLSQSLVAHGKGSGEIHAVTFSNKNSSCASSIGVLVSGKTYCGKHGYSLELHGLDKGYNDNALSRKVVIHGADYVSFDFIKKHNRIGRSWGCPALPVEKSKAIIDLIKDGTCIFSYYPDKEYLEKSLYMSEITAEEFYRKKPE
jgi:hypothetical protein